MGYIFLKLLRFQMYRLHRCQMLRQLAKNCMYQDIEARFSNPLAPTGFARLAILGYLGCKIREPNRYQQNPPRVPQKFPQQIPPGFAAGCASSAKFWPVSPESLDIATPRDIRCSSPGKTSQARSRWLRSVLWIPEVTVDILILPSGNFT